MADSHLNLTPAPQIHPLTAQQQFWWGFFGGCMIITFRLWFYALSLLPGTVPDISFRNCLVVGLSVAFPIISGFVSSICEPHSRLLAVYEGAAGPALFLFMAKDFPL
jgi:hypothetical protein